MEISNFSPNTLTGFNVNLQITFSHHNFGVLDEPSAIIQLFTLTNNKTSDHIIELNQSELESFIHKLKEIQKNLI